MDNSCFYYGVQTACGVHSGIFDSDLCENIFVISGGSSELKEKIFLLVSQELCRENIKNELLFSWEKCFGIFCDEKNFLIADENFLSKKEIEKAKKIFNLDETFSEKISLDLLHICLGSRRKKLERCQRFLTAANSIRDDMLRIDLQSTDVGKVIEYSSRLWKRCGGTLQGRVGTETKKFVSCVTSDGVELNMKAFDGCERLAVIADKTGAVSSLIVDRLRRYALGSGYDVVSCVCSLDSETVEHIIIPELKFGVFSSKYYHRIAPKKERKVYAERFHSKDRELVKNRLNFTMKAYRSLMNEAFESLKEAEFEERKLDRIFGNVIDPSLIVDEIINSL